MHMLTSITLVLSDVESAASEDILLRFVTVVPCVATVAVKAIEEANVRQYC